MQLPENGRLIIWLIATWLDELLIFAAMSVASSLGSLHIIMLGNEEMLKSDWVEGDICGFSLKHPSSAV